MGSGGDICSNTLFTRPHLLTHTNAFRVYPHISYIFRTYLWRRPLTASIVLAIMIIPTVSAVMRDLFMAVPNSQREAMIGLGATKWEITRTVISYARSGVIGAVILGLRRAVGETMAVTMVIRNKSRFGPLHFLMHGIPCQP